MMDLDSITVGSIGMPGPTTESLATDLRDSSREFRQFREDYMDFRGRIDTQSGFLRWLGTFLAALLVTVVATIISLTWQASAVSQKVELLERTTTKLIDRLEQVERTSTRTADRLGQLDQTMGKVVDRLAELERTSSRIADRLDQTKSKSNQP